MLVCVVLAAALVGSAPAARDASRAVARARALDAYSAMQRYFYSSADHSYAGTYPSRGHAQAWPFSQALWATIGVSSLTDAVEDLQDRLQGLKAYSHPEPGRPAEFAPVYGGSGRVYYDDNLWIALALVQTGDRAPLTTARRLFTLVGDGWDRDSSHPCPGGVFWTRLGTNHDRNTVTTANAALLALALYRRSGSTAYLTWAQRAYDWTKRCLGTSSGLVADHIDLAGHVDGHTWSYNQGAMIAAGVRLYRATGERWYLTDAEKTAEATEAKIGDPLATGEPPVFLAIFYRDLEELTAAMPGRTDRASAKQFADEAWTRSRDPKTGLFHFPGRGPTLLDQAAMVQIYSQLAEG
jgi:predicted alpha-1,6-mannanase (GH76 family)